MSEPAGELVLTEGDRLAPAEYRRLRAAVGWSDPAVEDGDLAVAFDASWNLTARNQEGELVGLARVLDDGALYASVWDVIVLPAHQRAGLGTRLLARVLERVGGRSLVALVGTRAGAALYRRAGFVSDDSRSTGMFRRG